MWSELMWCDVICQICRLLGFTFGWSGSIRLSLGAMMIITEMDVNVMANITKNYKCYVRVSIFWVRAWMIWGSNDGKHIKLDSFLLPINKFLPFSTFKSNKLNDFWVYMCVIYFKFYKRFFRIVMWFVVVFFAPYSFVSNNSKQSNTPTAWLHHRKSFFIDFIVRFNIVFFKNYFPCDIIWQSYYSIYDNKIVINSIIIFNW